MALVAAFVLACLGGVALASSSQAFTLTASLTPGILGAPTNMSTSMTLAEGPVLPKPVSEIVAFGPFGLALDLRGVATCERRKLEVDGPQGCPAESRVGFGGGVGAVQLSGTTVKEPFTLDFFLAPREHGHLRMLIHVNASSPIPVEFVLVAKEMLGPRPYGFGLAVEIPPIYTVPGAALASVESAFVSLGASNAAYYRTIHGHRKLVHIKGLVAPARCPRGGFPFKAIVSFDDGTSSTSQYLAHCPGGG